MLRPGGFFLYADFFVGDNLHAFGNLLKTTGFTVVHAVNITPNVVKSLTIDQSRREQLLRAVAEDESRYQELRVWAALPGTTCFQAYQEGRHYYYRYVLQKP